MSYHILHLLSPNLRVRLKLDQLHITDGKDGAERTVPLEDIAVIISATPDLTVTAGALRRMAELNVLLLVCNEQFEPCALTLPYYRATNTELLRRQLEWTPEWKQAMWRQVITAKIRNQAANLADLKRAQAILAEIANRCANGAPGQVAGEDADNGGPEARAPRDREPEVPRAKISLASITASKRAAFLSDSTEACESQAARHYWKHLLPRLRRQQQTAETTRAPGTREGVNGMLDYGYAILRTAVLRSLAAHGFIAAIGIAHAAKAGSFALADDLVEPLRPWTDQELRKFLEDGPRRMGEWMREVVAVLQREVVVNGQKIRMLNAIDLYVQSFANASLARATLPLRIPMLK